MPRPRAELRGRLRYRYRGPGPRLSLLHVRLSAAAERALRGCGRRQVGPDRAGGPGGTGRWRAHRRTLLLQGEPGPVIAFQGSQGCLTVPGDPGTPPRLFSFSLSRCGRDEPRGSFECVRLAEPRLGQSWVDSLGSIQEKITVCAWESTPAKEPCSRVVVEPDLAVLGYGMDPAACCCHGKGTPAGRAQEDWPGTVAQERQQDALLPCRSRDCGPSAPSFLVSLQQPPEHGSPLATGRNLLGLVSAGGLRRQKPLDARPRATSSSLAEVPDYLCRRSRYRTVCSSEQCRAYEAAFSADYGEYCDLHARVGSISRRFIQLGAKMKMLKQGTKERKARGRHGAQWCDAATLWLRSPPPFGFQALEAAIVHEYRHFKKTYPRYQQEKNRCEYLHQKLSHIKSLILQFEGSGSS
ncbi:rna polymerase ii elongation factor ell3 [Limosa lapponica baueri]|uniref:Rna polymerase ii elongation factor ell3 n=1 Tax=Limosa lapponica baueri TaxID=1758121 RepID=A0A2I0U3M6_LIMLA|nr:rna polymerase ii elongation factor ell3 [Limosa lapponica baueri]